jgi:DNA processing protein
LIRAVGEAAVAALHTGADAGLIHRTLDWLWEPGNHPLTLADEQYPRRLLKTVDPPLLLFVKGRVGLLDQPALAVVGSRNATRAGPPMHRP